MTAPAAPSAAGAQVEQSLNSDGENLDKLFREMLLQMSKYENEDGDNM